MTTHIGFLLFPRLLQLDLTGAYGVLAAGPEAQIHLVWKDTQPVLSSDALLLTPTCSFDECPQLDVLCVPGGDGILPLFEDTVVHNFLRTQAQTAKYITSVCTGSLVLGTAGLLKGYKATTHWQALEMLTECGAIPTHSRVVVDRNRLTAAGVTSGIDMALTLAALLWGEETAQKIQLGMEYAPAPPFMAGDPATAPEHIVKSLRKKGAPRQKARLEKIKISKTLRHS